MESHESRSDLRAPLGRRILGSAYAAIFGWAILSAVFLVEAFLERAEPRSNPPSTEAWFIAPTYISLIAAAMIAATWLVALLPLYLLIPRRSVLWSWPVCTVSGALAGSLIMCASFGPPGAESGNTPQIILAAITGALTCLFGSLTADRFHRNRAVQPA